MADRHTLPHELEQLAVETGCGAQVVRELYQGQFELLQRDARVRAYIPVLAMKHVRDVLRHNERRTNVLRA